MMIPTIHLNGTGKTTLLEELVAALTALNNAHDALCRVTVHGRDYYPQGPSAASQAIREHGMRRAAIEQVIEDLKALYTGIEAQTWKRL